MARGNGIWLWRWGIATAAFVGVLCLAGIWLVDHLGQRDANAASDTNPVERTSRVVPKAIADIPLLDQNGRSTDLAALHGRVVILADFMTSCQEECPITTGALLEVHRTLAADHLLGRISIVEVTVDPRRDNPARLRAYESLVGAHWEMLTGSAENIHELWSWFGVWYERVAEGKPASINWQTGKPYTFDIDHSDAVFVLNRNGNERALVTGDANVGEKLPKPLVDLLDRQGLHDLRRPGFGSWTPPEMLAAASAVLGQSIPDPAST